MREYRGNEENLNPSVGMWYIKRHVTQRLINALFHNFYKENEHLFDPQMTSYENSSQEKPVDDFYAVTYISKNRHIKVKSSLDVCLYIKFKEKKLFGYRTEDDFTSIACRQFKQWKNLDDPNRIQVEGDEELLKKYHQFIQDIDKNIYLIFKQVEEKREKEIELEKQKTKAIKLNILSNLDADRNGIVDSIENNDELITIIKKHQPKIISIDRKYIHDFIKISNYLKTKYNNIQSIFLSIKESTRQEELEENAKLLENQIHSYQIILFHSISMVSSLINDDMITFYEIYESFDKLNMFNSNWENEVSQELNEISDKLNNLMFAIQEMEFKIVSSLNHLSYTTKNSFKELSNSISSELKSINSSLDWNTLLTGVQTYQMYQINKNTKSLKG